MQELTLTTDEQLITIQAINELLDKVGRDKKRLIQSAIPNDNFENLLKYYDRRRDLLLSCQRKILAAKPGGNG